MGNFKDWQLTLEGHFASLKDSRPQSFPIFALEHGFSLDEVAEIKKAVADIRFIDPEFWLVWILYATECGYEYDGGEYWETFQKPLKYDWGHDVRGSLRRWFNRFQKSYHGVRPEGKWAEHFSIIAWPITHAIVPKYLQLQLAKKLYEFRYSLKNHKDLSPAQIGELLSNNSYDTTERFQIFLQQKEIVGRLAIAILYDKQDASQGDSHILDSTLQRIIHDLEKSSLAKSWLKATRVVVAETSTKVNLGGIKKIDSIPTEKTPTLNFQKQLSVTPILVRAKDSYMLGIQFDGFSELARKNPEIGTFLMKTRSRVSGSVDTNPPGWLIRGVPKKIITKAPSLNELPISFNADAPEFLLNLIKSDCTFLGNEVIIFKLNAEQVATYVKGKILKVGWKYGYLLLVRKNLLPKPYFNSISIGCEGLFCYHFDSSCEFDREDRDYLLKLGIQLSKNVSINPIGFMPIDWDGEGYAEWLNTDLITIKIEDNFHIDRYEVILDGKKKEYLPEGDKRIYLAIKNLDPGDHYLKINAIENRGWESISSAEIRIKIHDGATYAKPLTKKSFIATIQPESKNLDDFWEDRLNIDVFGPTGYPVEIILLLKSSTNTAIHRAQIGKFLLPITQNDFSKELKKSLNNDKNVLAYVEASSAELYIDGKELGGYKFSFNRDVKPLRWSTLTIGADIQIKLINELDVLDEAIPKIKFYAFENFLQAYDDLDYSKASFYHGVKNFGGLYTASLGEHNDYLIASSKKVAGGLQALNPIKEIALPDFNSLSSGEIINTIRLIGIWSKARCVGPLSNIRKSTVLKEFKRYLTAIIATPGWVKRERDYLGSRDISVIKKSYLSQRANLAVDAVLSMSIKNIDIDESFNIFYTTIKKGGIISSMVTAKNIYYLSVFPESNIIQDKTDQELDDLINLAKNNLSLVQLARLFFLQIEEINYV